MASLRGNGDQYVSTKEKHQIDELFCTSRSKMCIWYYVCIVLGYLLDICFAISEEKKPVPLRTFIHTPYTHNINDYARFSDHPHSVLTHNLVYVVVVSLPTWFSLYMVCEWTISWCLYNAGFVGILQETNRLKRPKKPIV